MLPDPKNNLLYLLEMLQSTEKCQFYARSHSSAEEFWEANEQMNFNAAITMLAQIGELSVKLTTELRTRHPEIPWKEIRGFRNRAVHDYSGLNILTVFQVIKETLPSFSDSLYALILHDLQCGNVDLIEFEAARSSGFYRWIDFQKFASDTNSGNLPIAQQII